MKMIWVLTPMALLGTLKITSGQSFEGKYTLSDYFLFSAEASTLNIYSNTVKINLQQKA